jgi:hypothetical protein
VAVQQHGPGAVGARTASAARSWAMATVVAVPAATSRRPRAGSGVCRASSRRSAATSSAPSASASGALAQVRRKHGARLSRTRRSARSPLNTASTSSQSASRRMLKTVG